MTATRRVRLPPAERRAQLVALGREMLAERTLEELSIEEIADAAGVSRGLLFHYFSGKAEFALEVAKASAAELIERTEPSPDWDAEDALRFSVAAYVDYVAENPQSYVSLVRGAASGDDAVRAVHEATRTALADRTIGFVTRFGFELPATERLAVRGWIAFSEEVTVNWCTLPDDARPSRDELLDLLTNALPALVLGIPLAELRDDERLRSPGLK